MLGDSDKGTGTMMRTLVAALTACLVCVALAGCGKSSSGGGSETAQQREVSSEARAAPGAGSTMIQREEAEDSPDSPDQ